MELIEQVINRHNMMRALQQVRQNKGSAGVDRMPVSELYDHLTKKQGKYRAIIVKWHLLATTHFGGRDTQGKWEDTSFRCAYRG